MILDFENIVLPGIEVSLSDGKRSIPEFINFYVTNDNYGYIGYGLKKYSVDTKELKVDKVDTTIEVPSIIDNSDIFTNVDADIIYMRINYSTDELFKNFINYLYETCEGNSPEYYLSDYGILAYMLLYLINHSDSFSTIKLNKVYELHDPLVLARIVSLKPEVVEIPNDVDGFIAHLSNGVYKDDKDVIKAVGFILNKNDIDISKYEIFKDIDVDDVDYSKPISLKDFFTLVNGANVEFSYKARGKEITKYIDFNSLEDIMNKLFKDIDFNDIKVVFGDGIADKDIELIFYSFYKFYNVLKLFSDYMFDINDISYLYLDYVKGSGRGKGSYAIILFSKNMEVYLTSEIPIELDISVINERIKSFYDNINLDFKQFAVKFIELRKNKKLKELMPELPTCYSDFSSVFNKASKEDKLKLLKGMYAYYLMHYNKDKINEIQSLVNLVEKLYADKLDNTYKKYYLKLKELANIAEKPCNYIVSITNKYSKEEDLDFEL